MDFKENTDRIIGDIRKGLEALGMIALLASPLDWGTKQQITGGEPTNGHTVNSKRKLQGRYMGVVRRLTVKQKKAVKAVREKSGYQAAIKKAKSYAREA